MITSLTVCGSGHDEICYDENSTSGNCPLCEAYEEASDLEQKIEDLEEELKEAQK